MATVAKSRTFEPEQATPAWPVYLGPSTRGVCSQRPYQGGSPSIQRQVLRVGDAEPQFLVTNLRPRHRQIIRLLGLSPTDYGL